MRITRDAKDKKFHVVGDLVVAPFSLLQSAMRELKRLLAACGDREVWIMEVLPRFLIMHCCDVASHCANVRKDGPAGTQACKKILTDLAELNALLAAHLTTQKVKMVATGDLLAGVKNASSGQLMDSMYSSWNQDPVHGEKGAYTRIGLGILDLIKKDPPGSRGTASAPGRGGGKTTRHQPVADPGKKIEAAASPVRGPDTGGTSLPPPTGPATQPTRSTLATSTAGGAAPRAAAAAGAATTSRAVRRPPRVQEAPQLGIPRGCP